MPPIRPYEPYIHQSRPSEKPASNTPTPYRTPDATATVRGPTRRIHNPPANAAKPKTKMAIVNVSVTSEIVHPNACVSGIRKTLQAYTAPSAICMTTPAAAMGQRRETGVIVAS